MNKADPEFRGVSPETLLSGLASVDWISRSSRKISGCHHQVDLFGYLNPLRPLPICVVSPVELEWCYAQTEQALLDSPVFSIQGARMVVLCRDCKPSPVLVSVCRARGIALAATQESCGELLGYLQSRVPRMVALREVQHGVLMSIMNVGVLLAGASGVGKSEVAMDLVQRGHQLVADDAVEIYRTERSELIGECPDVLRGYIEIRGLGIMNVLNMFGPSSLLDSCRLQLAVDLREATNEELRKVDRLAPSLRQLDILGIAVPCLTMLVAPGRTLSVLVEAAVRDHLLRESGINSSADFLQTHDRGMARVPASEGRSRG